MLPGPCTRTHSSMAACSGWRFPGLAAVRLQGHLRLPHAGPSRPQAPGSKATSATGKIVGVRAKCCPAVRSDGRSVRKHAPSSPSPSGGSGAIFLVCLPPSPAQVPHKRAISHLASTAQHACAVNSPWIMNSQSIWIRSINLAVQEWADCGRLCDS